ncbi:MAG: YeeE/YedE family protein [Crocinitomicaceae bacterium]|nr:YeeE/YedE family protein [Crocinitomicaceae bacterium]
MNELLNQLIYESWPWYIGGPLIGIFAISVLLLERKALGVSSSFEQFCSVALPAGESRNFILKDTWQIWFVFGMVLGGAVLFLSGLTVDSVAISEGAKSVLTEQGLTDLTGYAPKELYTFAIPQAIILVIGGFVIGFGARYAGGCTAGHSIMGIAQLAPSSIISTIGFFVGGLISTYLIVPQILSL